MDIAEGATWKKSSRSSGGSSNCVELANLSSGRLAVRDSKNPDGEMLVLSGQARATLMAAIRAGRLSG